MFARLRQSLERFCRRCATSRSRARPKRIRFAPLRPRYGPKFLQKTSSARRPTSVVRAAASEARNRLAVARTRRTRVGGGVSRGALAYRGLGSKVGHVKGMVGFIASLPK